MERKKRISNQYERNQFFDAHVLSYYSERELLVQVLYMHNGNRPYNVNHAARDMVQGGCFLCYYDDIDQLRKENPGCLDRRYSLENAWEQYCRQVERAIIRIYKKQILEPGDVYAIAKDTMYNGFIEHHGNGNGLDDLYLKKTPVSDAIVERMKNKSLLSTFVSPIDNAVWYEFPFCYPGTVKGDE